MRIGHRSVVLLLVAFGMVCLACGGLKPTGTSPSVKKDDGSPKKYTRANFEKLVIGKTPNEIIKLIGRPRETLSDSADLNSPTYRGGFVYSPKEIIVIDPASEKPMNPIIVNFRDGKVENVN